MFFAFLIYLGWDGGQVGSAVAEGLRWLIGKVHYVVPVALLARARILMMRPVLPPCARSGPARRACSWDAGLLPGRWGTAPAARAAGPEVSATAARWGRRSLGRRTLLGDVGAHILAVFLFLAGVLLLTGASVAGVVRATGEGRPPPRACTAVPATRVRRRGGSWRSLRREAPPRAR